MVGNIYIKALIYVKVIFMKKFETNVLNQ